MATANSTSTTGGISFDQLCRGDQLPSYVCDRECLVDILREDTLKQAEKKLITNIDTLFKDIEIQKEATIDKFYIGKTYVITRKNSSMDPMNPWTWRKDGISSRWQHHMDKDYCKDGMIVIAVITKDQVPTHRQPTVLHQEDYTLQLEKRLIEYYKRAGDTRIANKTLKSGASDGRQSAGYALYVTFSLEDNEQETSEDSFEAREDTYELLSNHFHQSLNLYDTQQSDDNTSSDDDSESIVKPKPLVACMRKNVTSLSSKPQRGQIILGYASTEKAKEKGKKGIEVDTFRQRRSVKDENHSQTFDSPCKPKKQNKCSNCRQPGHNIRTCPELK